MKSQRIQSALYLLAFFIPPIIFFSYYVNDGHKLALKDYLQDHFRLTKVLYKLNTQFQVKYLNASDVGQIHIGRDGWLFYLQQEKNSTNAKDDFWGVSTDGVLRFWSAYFKKSVLRPYGFKSKYLFFAVPNKETVYPEMTHYPFLSYRQTGVKNYDQIINMMRKLNPNSAVDVLDTLIKNKGGFPTYHRADTHWNYWGAYLAHVEILKSVSRLLNENIQPLPINQPKIEWNAVHDLYDTLVDLDLTSVVPFHSLMDMNVTVSFVKACCGKPITVVDSHYYAYENPERKHVVWLIGDSFSRYLSYFFSNYFRKTCVIISGPRTDENIRRAYKETGYPDLIIEERAERGLASKVPYFDAASTIPNIDYK